MTKPRIAALARRVAPSVAAFVGPALFSVVLYLLTVGTPAVALAAGVIAGLVGLLGAACSDAARSWLAHRREVAEMTAIADSLHGAQLYVAPDDTVRVQFEHPDRIRLYPRHDDADRVDGPPFFELADDIRDDEDTRERNE